MIAQILELFHADTSALTAAGVLLALAAAAFVGCGMALTVIDLREHRLPNRIVYPWTVATFTLLAIVAALASELDSLVRGVVSGLLWAGGFLIVRLIHPPAIGMGDVKLAAVLGLYAGFLGWEMLGTAVVLSFLLGGLVSLVMVAARRATRSTRIPFGPFLILGTALVLVGAPAPLSGAAGGLDTG